MKAFLLSNILVLLAFSGFAQSIGQVVRGKVIDNQSQTSIPGANIVILNTNPVRAAISDAAGHFKLENVLPGKYDLKVSYLGYKEVQLSNIEVSSGKEVVLDIGMEEAVNALTEVEVTTVKKSETNNDMTSVSGRAFSMEEVNRYAGGRSDVSRLASNFAGVSSPNDARNDIVIRGNSPTGVLWRIEGLNIPNPNHFATVGTTGGPVSAINTNIIKNSDFFTSAFPAEYGNANAGVFDLGFRVGNAEKREHTFQFGALTGIEAMTEGPINKAKGSSYVIAYRYSFTGVAQAVGIPIGTAATPYYQDLSFKVNGGETKAGRFTLFGIGAKSRIDFTHDKIDQNDLFADPTKDSYFTSDIALVGLKHFIKVNNNSYFSTVIGATFNGANFLQDKLIGASEKTPVREIENLANQTHYSINTSYNSKVNSQLFYKVGVIVQEMNLNLNARSLDTNNVWNQFWDTNDFTTLVQAYIQAKYKFTDKLTLNAGLQAQQLTLNNSQAIGPRIGLKYQITEKGSLNFGYGLHSQMQPIDVYFYRRTLADGSYNTNNDKLGFTKSHHLVLGYDWLPIKDWRVKTEVYYQYLFDVPVHTFASSYSMLNAGASFLPNTEVDLENKGTGRNYGAELTIEKFFSKGYYVLLTGSIYRSLYTASDNIERNTGFSGNYVYNVLAGKDFKVGKDKRNTINIGCKLTQAGGRYFTPVDLQASQLNKVEVLMGDSAAFTDRNPDFFRFDVKVGFTLNGKSKKLTQSWSLDIQNVTNHKNVFAQRYNTVTNKVNTAYQIGFFPNFVYKVEF